METDVPLEVGVSVVGVDEERWCRFRLAQCRYAADVAVRQAVEVETLVQHHRQLLARRVICTQRNSWEISQ